MNEYCVWRQQSTDRHVSRWIQSSHTLKARTDKEAESRLRRRFANAGFQSMRLVAVPAGVDPNVPQPELKT